MVFFSPRGGGGAGGVCLLLCDGHSRHDHENSDNYEKTVKKESFMKKVVKVVRSAARRSLIPRSSVIKHKLDRRKKEKEKAWIKEYQEDPGKELTEE